MIGIFGSTLYVGWDYPWVVARGKSSLSPMRNLSLRVHFAASALFDRLYTYAANRWTFASPRNSWNAGIWF